jgi:site-specific DNA-methyltransferase (adenine-specific)
MNTYIMLEGDNMNYLNEMKDNSIDAGVTDAPYGLGPLPDPLKLIRFWGKTGHMPVTGKGFMGKSWDAFVPQPRFWREFCRVLKPGGYVACFFSTKTYDLGVFAMRLAGFEICDQLSWIYGEGRPICGHVRDARGQVLDGLGKSLKPAHDPIVLARKPFSGSVLKNVMLHGTGALQIDGCRVGDEGGYARNGDVIGRWPSNIITDGSPEVLTAFARDDVTDAENPATRFFKQFPCGPEDERSLLYCPKASRKERNAGCEHLESRPFQTNSPYGAGAAARKASNTKGSKNNHPTLKPLALTRWLIRLVTPKDGVVLDPFAGSGTTGCAAVYEGRSFVGIEQDAAHCKTARARIDDSLKKVGTKLAKKAKPAAHKEDAKPKSKGPPPHARTSNNHTFHSN